MQYILRALALENANTISKGNLAFVALKSSASENCKGKYCNFFLQYCYSTILKIELHCSSIVKKKINILSLTLSSLSLISHLRLSFQSTLLYSHSVSPSPTPYFSPSNPIKLHSHTHTFPPLPPQFHPQSHLWPQLRSHLRHHSSRQRAIPNASLTS